MHHIAAESERDARRSLVRDHICFFAGRTRVGHLDDAYIRCGKPVGVTLYQLTRQQYKEFSEC
ncbi:host cell division inhibitor Icd-like protein [Escherichia coli]